MFNFVSVNFQLFTFVTVDVERLQMSPDPVMITLDTRAHTHAHTHMSRDTHREMHTHRRAYTHIHTHTHTAVDLLSCP